MSPKLEDASFGQITADGEMYQHDILIRLSGKVKKRKKKLSKKVYGTSHTISIEEIEHIYEKGCPTLIVGTGQYDQVRLSPEASRFLVKRNVVCILQPTPQAVETYNKTAEPKIGLFHVTC